MTSPSPGLVMQLLAGGIPPSLLIDLTNPEGLRAALASEVLVADVAAAPAPAPAVRSARSA